MSSLVNVYVEIPKGSNQKYEFNKTTGKLELDRVLPEPFHYPYAYGFIVNTLAQDGDELDALILTAQPLLNECMYECRVVAVLLMEDEKGVDEKILVVPKDEHEINDLVDISPEIIDEIWTFFGSYKLHEYPQKWSEVHGVQCKREAMNCVKKYTRTSINVYSVICP